MTMSKNKKIIIILFTALSVVILLSVTAAVIYFKITARFNEMIVPMTIMDHNHNDDEYVPDEKNNEHFYALIIGLDYRDQHEALLTDSLLVLHIIPEDSTVKLLSIPRDLLVENTRGNVVKINSLFSEGRSLFLQKTKDDPSILTGDTVRLGATTVDKIILSGAMANTRSKIEELLNTKIDYTFLVNFNAVISLVDEVGGIEIDVKRSMRYKQTNLYLEPGLQILNGEDALGYARFRLDDRGSRYYISDFERGQNQQQVVKALVDEILSWRNVTKVFKILDNISENVKTDMNLKEMYSMIRKYYNEFHSNSFVSIPFPEHYTQDGDVIIPDEALEQLRDEFDDTD